MPLLFLIFIWFFAEISTFISVGSEFGAGLVIMEIIFSMIIGTWLIKKVASKGMAVMMTMGGSGLVGTIVCGILLIIPGMITDTLGILALIPGTLNFILTVLGLGRKIDMNTFIKNRMGGMGGFSSGGANPFGGMNDGKNPNTGKGNPFGEGTNPFMNAGQTRSNKTKPNGKAKSKPLDRDIIDGDVVRKYEKKD